MVVATDCARFAPARGFQPNSFSKTPLDPPFDSEVDVRFQVFAMARSWAHIGR